MGLIGCVLFHLNLRYSSVEVAERGRVIERCYHPMLDLLERVPGLELAVEASGHTLELALELDPGWIARLRSALDAGRVELVGSGDTQLVGPLVPRSVNAWNQRLGVETYERILGRRPRAALVAELAFSQGIVEAYREAGYELLLAEWNNPRAAHPEWPADLRYRLARTADPSGGEIDLAWIDSAAFQQLQRVVAGELEVDEYLERVEAHAADEPRALFLYASDAEVFGFRPGRYAAEPAPAEDEWGRVAEALAAFLARDHRIALPSALGSEPALAPRERVTLASAAQPIPVKKQPKYNVTRWALSGRDDPGWNARCFARERELARAGTADPRAWRSLCRAWASDLRTHLTERRARARAAAPAEEPPAEDARAPLAPSAVRSVRRDGRRLAVATDGLEVVLNLRRGLAVESARRAGEGGPPLFGTLPHGTFDAIAWLADFYSGHTVLDVPGRRRVTDLAPCEPRIEERAEGVLVSSDVPTALGPLPKRVLVGADGIELEVGLAAWGARPLASLRSLFVTLPPVEPGERLEIACANGGAPERFALDGAVDHGRSASPFVSASAAFGATDGSLEIARGSVALELAWRPEVSAALPLATSVEVGGRRFARVALSVSEVDETHVPGAPLRDLSLRIRVREAGA